MKNSHRHIRYVPEIKGLITKLRNDVGCIAEIQDALWWPDAEVSKGTSLHFTSIEEEYTKVVLSELRV
jgi:hypothetical protein